MDGSLRQFDFGRMLDTLHAFDKCFDVEQTEVPVLMPTVMVLMLPPFIPIPLPVPTTVAWPMPIVRFRLPTKPAQTATAGTAIPVEVVVDEA